MKIEVETEDGVKCLKVDFPTDDGTCLGEPVVCINLGKGSHLNISKNEFFKVYRKFLGVLANTED